MAPHSSTLAWKIPWMEKAWWAAVHGVTQSLTRLKRLGSSSSRGSWMVELISRASVPSKCLVHSRGSLNLCGILSRLSLSARLQSGKDNLLGSCLCFALDTVRSFFLLLFGLYVVSDSLGPHELRYTRLPCPSLSSGVCSNSCPLSQRCHPTISSSVIPFSSCLQSFPASESLPMSGLFASGGQSIGASALVPVPSMNISG